MKMLLVALFSFSQLLCNFLSITVVNNGTEGSSFNLSGNVKDHFNSGFRWADFNRWKVVIASVASGYAYENYRLLNLNSFLADSSNWHSWKLELGLEDLFDIQQEALGQQLIKDIQKKYVSDQNPTDFFGPLISFNKDISLEIEKLEEYIKISNYIKSYNLEKFFLQVKLDLAKNRLQRLRYINSIFKNWSSEYKSQKIEQFYRRKRQLSIIQVGA